MFLGVCSNLASGGFIYWLWPNLGCWSRLWSREPFLAAEVAQSWRREFFNNTVAVTPSLLLGRLFGKRCLMSSLSPLAYCFSIPPIRSRLMVYLPVMDIVSISISLNIKLSEYEKTVYLNPTKDILDLYYLKKYPLY